MKREPGQLAPGSEMQLIYTLLVDVYHPLSHQRSCERKPYRACRLCYRGGSLWRGGLPEEPGTVAITKSPASLSSLSISLGAPLDSHLLPLLQKGKPAHNTTSWFGGCV